MPNPHSKYWMSVCNWHLKNKRQILATLAMRIAEASIDGYHLALDNYYELEGIGSNLAGDRFDACGRSPFIFPER